MSREHKYRGKRLDNGEWVYGYYLYNRLNNSHFICFHKDVPHLDRKIIFIEMEVDPATVGESTGLKDSDGKEAYGGDKVLWDWNKEHRKIEGVIEWDREQLAWVITNCYFQHNRKVLLAHHPEIEIIGNVHDIPELLKTGP